jgi:hypothetical protein
MLVASCASTRTVSSKAKSKANVRVRMPAQTGQVGEVNKTVTNLDTYIGVYRGKNKNGEVTIKKIQTKAADLFAPAEYEYTISLDYSASKGFGFYLEDKTLTLNKTSNTLSLSYEDECDDPGCWYSIIDISILMSAKNEPYIELRYTSSVPDPDYDQVVTEDDGKKLFFKVNE